MAELAGKKRSFWRGLALTLVTLGLYSIYWWYKAFREVYVQEDRPFPTALYWCFLIPLVNFVTILVYGTRGLRTLNDGREARGIGRSLGFGIFFLLLLIPLVGGLIAYALVTESLNEYWDAAASHRPPVIHAKLPMPAT